MGWPADDVGAAVDHVHRSAVAAWIERVGADAGGDEPDLAERLAVDEVEPVALQIGHVEDAAVG